MKKQLTILTGLILASLSWASAQSSDKMNEIYSRYSSGEGVFSMSLNKQMLNAVDMDFDIEDHMENLSGDIHQLKFISFMEESRPGITIEKLDREIANAGLKPLPFPGEGHENLKFFSLYGDRQDDHFENIYMLVLTEDGETGLFFAVNGKLKINGKS